MITCQLLQYCVRMLGWKGGASMRQNSMFWPCSALLLLGRGHIGLIRSGHCCWKPAMRPDVAPLTVRRCRGSGSVSWRDIGWRELPQRQYSWQHDRQLQVYGGCWAAAAKLVWLRGWWRLPGKVPGV